MEGFVILDKNMNAILGDNISGIGIECNTISGKYLYFESIIDCMKFWTLKDERLFLAECGNRIEYDCVNPVIRYTKSIKLIREINQKEINDFIKNNLDDILKYEDFECIKLNLIDYNYNRDRYVHDTDYNIRVRLARNGYGLDRFVKDHNKFVRAEVAKRGYHLDILVEDHSSIVREEVAENGYGLEKLVNDPDPSVRARVAEKGYGLEKLVDDSEPCVRVRVAEKRYGLEKLVYDKEWNIRITVASQGYGLEKLINDTCIFVREEAERQLKK